MKDIDDFVKARDAALLSLDPRVIQAFAARYGAAIPPPDSPVFWMAVHKARTGARTLPEAARRESITWLKERGMRHLADDLAPPGKNSASGIETRRAETGGAGLGAQPESPTGAAGDAHTRGESG